MKKVKAKKHLGQHFLEDLNIAENIVNLLEFKNETILEIGPGMGVLTQFLVKKNIDFEVIELDRESVFYLRLNYPKLKIIEGDFLKINISEIYTKPMSLIGNFPYNISSQILFKAFENRNTITEVVGMFQKEVAERIASLKGKKKGILSVLLQAFYNIEYCFTVDEYVFNPPPKVKSGVIKLVRNTRKKLDCDEKLFIQIVKTGYNQRRKTLRNSLKSFSLEPNSEIDILLQKRAEQLDVEDFIKLTQHVEKKRNK
ncbi:MAG: 16S rRNA (adenine(1518)-N(6)/adenine(1519)-N(6))-dimethyltransferase RsmA [Flavobacteriales bacterium]|jgi:16S rRNA (adenine1518-N6/adenine1519-N6)-dimethyltransferase|nr:16S rRNA (adenine(1518)-N(6)/adenine(1519)-N(6))-dimethyltransferase RsmA [Flavobacteriales bacterium]MBT7481468.1 16S rRNA (adenine(1518)-N(6)/adenine(1519)-N(6))-dimethyltransferase RsmA [Flavobacteriales bacterium]